jgi:hypothetical protein
MHKIGLNADEFYHDDNSIDRKIKCIDGNS